MRLVQFLFSLFIIFSHLHPAKAMGEEKWDKSTSVRLNDGSKMKCSSFKKHIQELHGLGLKAIEDEDYSSAFKNFLFVTFEALLYAPFQYDLEEEGESLSKSGTLTQFNHIFNHNKTDHILGKIINFHLTSCLQREKETARNRVEAFGYVYILWQSNGKGLEKESSLGKSMDYCLQKETAWSTPQELKPLIAERFPEEKQEALLKKSAGWVLK